MNQEKGSKKALYFIKCYMAALYGFAADIPALDLLALATADWPISMLLFVAPYWL